MSRIFIFIISILISSLAYAQESVSDKALLLKAITSAYKHPSAGAADKKVFGKVLKNKASTNFSGIQVDILGGAGKKFVVLNEKSVNGTLFIANNKGKIIFSIPNWAEEYKVFYPFYTKEYVGLGRITYSDKSGKEDQNILVNHIFRLQDQKAINVLTYTHALNFCINNELLPIDLKDELKANNASFNACKAKAKVISFSEKEAIVEFMMVVKKGFLTDSQYKKVLKYISFPSSGKKKYKWKFTRNNKTQPYTLTEGEDVNTIDGSSLILSNLSSGESSIVNEGSIINNDTTKTLKSVDELLRKVDQTLTPVTRSTSTPK